MTPAEELRAAAAKVRETAEHATKGPWKAELPIRREYGGLDFPISSPEILSAPDHVAYVDVSPEAAVWAHQVNGARGDAAWIALAHPGLAEHLAPLLDLFAAMYEVGLVDAAGSIAALNLARDINGGAS